MHFIPYCQARCAWQLHRKLGKIMKLSAILIMASLQVAMAGSAQTVSLSVRDVPLKDIFDLIYEQTGYEFLYNSQMLERAKPVTLDVKKVSLQRALRLCFKDQPLTYILSDKTIVVRPKTDTTSNATRTEGEERIITGKVTDERGNPLGGATVQVKGTNSGMVTDVDGNFTLVYDESDPDATLLIRYLGYINEEVLIGNQSNITISLVPDATALGEIEVVSTGYYEVEERLNPGNIAKVGAKEIAQQSVENPLQALQGRVAGVQIQQTTGVPGGEININIRGVNSLNNGQTLGDGTILPNANRPFFVVDGVPFTNTLANGIGFLPLGNGNPLAFINPRDIASIEILKDADATAIYGSRGANGVVLITTRQGESGKASLDINFSRGWGEVPKKLDLLNTAQYLEMRREAFRNDGEVPTAANAPDLLLWDTTRYTDWQEVLIGEVAEQTNAGISFSGGGRQTRFLFRSDFFEQGNVYNFDDSKFRRLSGLLNLSHASVDQRFMANISVNYNYTLNIQNGLQPTREALRLPPNAPALFDELGNLNWENSTWDNPLALLNEEYENITKNLVLNTSLKYELMEGLIAKVSLGYTNQLTDETRVVPLASRDPATGAPGSLQIGNSNIETWILEPQLEYRRNISKGILQTLIGATLQEDVLENESVFGSGYQNDALIRDITAAARVSAGSSLFSEYRYTAVYARLNYNWSDKYLLNLTGRRDGSSRFGPGNQFGNFGAVGAAWIFTEESFIKDRLDFLSFGKLRASLGTVGSDQIGNYQFLNSFTGGGPYNEEQVLVPSRAANPDYSWETTEKLEFGLELGLFEGRVNINTSWFRNRTSDQLIGRPLPGTTGFRS